MAGRAHASGVKWCALLPLFASVSPAVANFDPASPDFHFDTAPGVHTSLKGFMALDKGAEARKIAFGIAEAFLNGTKLQHGEAHCLEKSLGGLAGEFVDVCTGAVKILSAVARKEVPAQQGAPASSSPASGLLAQPQPAAQPALLGAPVSSAPPRQAQALGPTSSTMFGGGPSPIMSGAPQSSASMNPSHLQATFALMTIASNLYEMMHQEARLAKHCLHKDAVEALELAAYHMSNVTYMGNNLGANGAVIASELAYAVEAFDKQDYLGFGIAIGTAARKTVLAKNVTSSGDMLTPKSMQEISAGLMKGLFADGITLHIDAELNSAAFVPKGTKVDLATVDIRQCVLGNADFFRVAWSSAVDLFETISNQATAADNSTDGFPDKLPDLDPSSMMEMSQLVLYMPSALRMCNITKEQEEFLMDAMVSGNEALDPSVSMHRPSSSLKQLVESATEAWAAHEYLKMGERLGQMMRDMALVAFPEKYSITDLAEQPVEKPFLLPCLAAVLAAIVAVVASLRGWRAFKLRGTGRRSQSFVNPDCEEEALVSSPPLSARSSSRKGSCNSVRFDVEQGVE